MSFLTKIKNFLGIGGVKVKLTVPDKIAKSDNVVGHVTLVSKSDQFMKDLTLKLTEDYSTGTGEDRSSSEFTLGMIKIDVNREIKAGETQEITFDFPFEMIKSENDRMKDKGGLSGMMGKMSSFADVESSTFYVCADLDVDKTALDPSDKKKVKLV